ncbi:MAG: 30S ribosomal protein S19 [Patescibacteria group bacterium]
MARSSKKGYFVDEKLMKKVAKLQGDEKRNAVIKTWARSSTVTPEMVGITFDIHNGKSFIAIKISEDMVGHKLGEFALTRKFTKHGGKLQREQEGKVKK